MEQQHDLAKKVTVKNASFTRNRWIPGF